MSQAQSLEEALAPISAALEADGARLELAPVIDGELKVEVVLRPDACGECVLPPSEMEHMMLDLVREVDTTVRDVAVEIVQPDDGGAPAPGRN